MSKNRKVRNSNTKVGGLTFVLKLRSVIDACNSCYDCKVLFQSLASDRRTTPTQTLSPSPERRKYWFERRGITEQLLGVLIWKCFTGPEGILIVSLWGSDGFFRIYRDRKKIIFLSYFRWFVKETPLWSVFITVVLHLLDTLFDTVCIFSFLFFATSTFSSFLWMRCKYDDVTDATFSWSYGGAQLHRLLLVSLYRLLAHNVGSRWITFE